MARLVIPPSVLGLAAIFVLSGEWRASSAPAAAQATPTPRVIVSPSVTPGAPANTPIPPGTPRHETLTPEQAWEVIKKGLPAQTPTADSLLASLLDDTSLLLLDLQWVTGSRACSDPCSLDFDRGRVLERTISSCATSMYADNVRTTPQYDVNKHEAILSASAAACDGLKSAEKTLGRPSDSPAWRQVALTAQARLEAVLAAGSK